MYMKKKGVYLFVSMILLTTSCEYRVGENFVEMEEVSPDSTVASIQLNLLKDDEGVYHVDETQQVGYTVFSLPGYKVEKCVFRLEDMEWESEGSEGSFLLDVDKIRNGRHELTCEIVSGMNTGTVAAQMGMEYRTEERNWPVKVEAREETDLPLRHRVNEAGFLEISWDADESLRSSFDHYSIEFSVMRDMHYTYVRKSSRFDERVFVDKDYAGGGATYTVYIYFKDETIRPYSLGKAVLEQVDPQVKAEYPGDGLVRLSWTNPYRSLVDVVYGGKVVASKVADGKAEFALDGQAAGGQVVELRFGSADGSTHVMTSFSYMFNLENGEKR